MEISILLVIIAVILDCGHDEQPRQTSSSYSHPSIVNPSPSTQPQPPPPSSTTLNHQNKSSHNLPPPTLHLPPHHPFPTPPPTRPAPLLPHPDIFIPQRDHMPYIRHHQSRRFIIPPPPFPPRRSIGISISINNTILRRPPRVFPPHHLLFSSSSQTSLKMRWWRNLVLSSSLRLGHHIIRSIPIRDRDTIARTTARTSTTGPITSSTEGGMLLQRGDALAVRRLQFREPGCGFRFSGGAAGLGGFEPGNEFLVSG